MVSRLLLILKNYITQFGKVMKIRIISFFLLSALVAILGCNNEEKYLKDKSPNEQIVMKGICRDWKLIRMNEEGLGRVPSEGSMMKFEFDGTYHGNEDGKEVKGKWSLKNDGKIIEMIPEKGKKLDWEIFELNDVNFRVRFVPDSTTFEYLFER
jgi:hypothetical protein